MTAVVLGENDKARCLLTAADLKPGALVLSADPYVFVANDEALACRCSACFKTDGLRACSKCKQVKYCSTCVHREFSFNVAWAVVMSVHW